jgi:hypothetical protein
MTDFTFAMYQHLLDAISTSGYHTYTLKGYLVERPQSGFLILRHDVDLAPLKTLTMAKMEAERGFRSTCYFRTIKSVFCPEIMCQIQDMGHEVGYHFETLDTCKGDFRRSIALYEQELALFRKIGIAVETVCSHGNPRVKKVGYSTDNEIFLYDEQLMARTSILGEAYLSVDFSKLHYFSDNGRTWNSARNTKEVISQIRQKVHAGIYLLVHPHWWAESAMGAITLRTISTAAYIRYFLQTKQFLRYLKVPKG